METSQTETSGLCELISATPSQGQDLSITENLNLLSPIPTLTPIASRRFSKGSTSSAILTASPDKSNMEAKSASDKRKKKQPPKRKSQHSQPRRVDGFVYIAAKIVKKL